MSEERIVYGVCDANCRVPVYSREQMLAILQQAIEAGSLQGVDITKSPVVRLIRESRADQNISFWVGTEAEYNAISPAVVGALVMARIDANGNVYLCTDDTTFSNWQAATLEALQEQQAEAMNAFKENVNTDVANKADKVTGATAGNFAGLDANGNLTDSGKKAADFQTKHATATVTLAVASWSSNAQTVSAAGVTADNTVIVAPAAASQEAYTAAGVKCTAQAAGTLTFGCEETPKEALTVNVVILGV